MNKMSSQDRSSLIRLASSLPVGSPEKRAILTGLQKVAAKWPHPTLHVEITFEDTPATLYVMDKGSLVWFLQKTYNIKPPSAKYREIVSGNFTLPKAWKKPLIEAGAVKYQDGPFGNGPNGGPTLPDGSIGKLAGLAKTSAGVRRVIRGR